VSDIEIPDEIVDAATRAAHDHTYYYSDFPLTDRDLGIMRSSTRAALRAALDAGLADLIRKPRVITTVEELEDLPVGSVIMEGPTGCPVNAGPFGIPVMPGVFHRFPDDWYVVAGHGASVPQLDLGPLTVLYDPRYGAR